MKKRAVNNYILNLLAILIAIVSIAGFFAVRRNNYSDVFAENQTGNNPIYAIITDSEQKRDDANELSEIHNEDETFKVIEAGAVSNGKSGENIRAEIEILYRGKSFKFKDELIEATDHLVAETIQNRKINSPLDEKIHLVDRCLNSGAGIKDAMLYCFPLLYKVIDRVKKEVNTEYVDSQISFYPDRKPMFYITKEKVGFELCENRLYQEIYLYLRRNNKVKIVAPVNTLSPSVTSYDNIKLTTLRSRFSTDYANSIENRKHNIKLALSKVNGTVLNAGEEFSFNKIVGKRLEKYGFLEAKIIMGGEYVEGFGGGVCQASTTIYNAALRADMSITQARNHSLTPSYVQPSFDAMVNSSSSDLKFKNSGAHPVFIRSYGTNTTAVVEIYGTKLPYKISAESVITSKGEPPEDKEILDTERKYVSPYAQKGERLRVSYGHGALTSEGYLIYINDNGKQTDKKLIRKDTYKSSQGIIAIAPGNELTNDMEKITPVTGG